MQHLGYEYEPKLDKSLWNSIQQNHGKPTYLFIVSLFDFHVCRSRRFILSSKSHSYSLQTQYSSAVLLQAYKIHAYLPNATVEGATII
jgi:hypothetical protein